MRRRTYTNTTTIDQTIHDRYQGMIVVPPGGTVTYEPRIQGYDTFENAMHLGDLWMLSYIWAAVANGATAALYFRIHDDVEMDIKFAAKAAGLGEFEIYEDPNVANNGTNLSPMPAKVGMTAAHRPQSVFSVDPGVNFAGGNLVYQEYLGAVPDELKLSKYAWLQFRAGHNYLVRFTNNSVGAVVVNLIAYFAELDHDMDLSPEE